MPFFLKMCTSLSFFLFFFFFTVKYHIFYAGFLSQFSFLYYLKVINVESGTADN